MGKLYLEDLPKSERKKYAYMYEDCPKWTWIIIIAFLAVILFMIGSCIGPYIYQDFINAC